MKTAKIVILFLLLSVFAFPLCGQSLKSSMDKAAEYFVKSAINIEPDQELHILEIIDLNSGKHNETGKRIETELYFALERQLPDFKLFLGKKGNPEKSIFLEGTFERKGDEVVVKLRILKGSEVLAQTETSYEKMAHRRTLVAVLDMEAESLNLIQRKAFSNIFRSSLIEQKAFDIASSADVDKADPDAIQRATGCSRDQCATIIGEQLGVDRTISSSIFKITDNLFVLEAKIIDIKDGSILKSKTEKHNGDLATLDIALEKLAVKLTADVLSLQTISRNMGDQPLSEGNTPREEITSSDSSWPWWYYAVAGVLIAGAAAAASAGDSEGGEEGGTEGGDVTYTW